jgi:mRNA interferase MazF
MKQYSIWWADLPPPVGSRPVLLLSRDQACRDLDVLLVAVVTTKRRHIPVELSVGRAEGLRRDSVVNFDRMMEARKNTLISRIGALPGRRIVEAKRAMGWALEWYELIHL